jgi:hypothetical protein
VQKETHQKTLSILNKITFKVKNENDFEYKNYKEILRQVDIDYIKTHTYTLEDRKIVSYLKAVLLHDNQLLDDLTESIYSFSYKYVEYDRQIGGKYLGQTIVQYTYFNTSLKAIYNTKKYSMPILIMNKYYQSVEAILYNIGIKLTMGMSENEFERTIKHSRLPKIKIKDISGIDELITKFKIVCVVKVYGEMNQVVKIKKLKDDDMIYPIFITSTPIIRMGEKSLNINKARPNCNESLLSVYMGRSKIFTLPYWKCDQTDNMTFNDIDTYYSYPFNELLSNRRLEKILKEKINYPIDSHTPRQLNKTILKNKIIEETMKRKIYDLDLTNLLREQPHNDILKLFRDKPLVDRKISKRHGPEMKIYQKDEDIDYDMIFKNIEPATESIKKAPIELFSSDDDFESLQNIVDDDNPQILDFGNDFDDDHFGPGFKIIPNDTLDLPTDDFLIDDNYDDNVDIMPKGNTIDIPNDDFLLDDDIPQIPADDTTATRTITEFLRENATSIDYGFVDEFIIEDNFEIDILDNLVIDDEPVLPVYYGADHLNMGGYDVSIHDVFVYNKPQIQRTKQGHGYMVMKLQML